MTSYDNESFYSIDENDFFFVTQPVITRTDNKGDTNNTNNTNNNTTNNIGKNVDRGNNNESSGGNNDGNDDDKSSIYSQSSYSKEDSLSYYTEDGYEEEEDYYDDDDTESGTETESVSTIQKRDSSYYNRSSRRLDVATSIVRNSFNNSLMSNKNIPAYQLVYYYNDTQEIHVVNNKSESFTPYTSNLLNRKPIYIEILQEFPKSVNHELLKSITKNNTKIYNNSNNNSDEGTDDEYNNNNVNVDVDVDVDLNPTFFFKSYLYNPIYNDLPPFQGLRYNNEFINLDLQKYEIRIFILEKGYQFARWVKQLHGFIYDYNMLHSGAALSQIDVFMVAFNRISSTLKNYCLLVGVNSFHSLLEALMNKLLSYKALIRLYSQERDFCLSSGVSAASKNRAEHQLRLGHFNHHSCLGRLLNLFYGIPLKSIVKHERFLVDHSVLTKTLHFNPCLTKDVVDAFFSSCKPIVASLKIAKRNQHRVGTTSSTSHNSALLSGYIYSYHYKYIVS
ncbi:uncharacterized protein ASCRUDRAFT_75620 [Ascoidea rubescens DSM 1968]|uniref:Uncharacterized protein n=1 Tax=Ascoidea rubescens DSM 1968 TaxID=1344418 RepID=A0A1D2VJ90_9ASCO|nr:hypothetical protein ASCRUDRAFT_75620 [Ascoidea rubescens DSM 1968]ODV61630.1 hypothetical protein ASCRUDRAFT_75620 [Ascoidea rubescens DSM 1968]